MKYIVLKFGGSSMCNKGYTTMLQQIKEKEENEYTTVIVVSAIGKTTNQLYKITQYEGKDVFESIYDTHANLAKEMNVDFTELNECLTNLNKEIELFKRNPAVDLVKQRIQILSYGEILSSIFLHNLLESHGISNNLINARSFIKSESFHTEIDPYNLNIRGEFSCNTDILLNLMNYKETVYVTQGFIASTSDCYPCILSRSGSDTSASLIASGLQADRVEIWTDVNGLYTADPNIIPEALLIKEINYDIAQEISASGSKVIHPFCALPCQRTNVPIWIRNTFDPLNNNFSVINGFNVSDPNTLYSISSQKGITIFNIEAQDMWRNYGFVGDIFKIFSFHSVDVNIITTSHISVSTTTDEISEEKKKLVFNDLKKKYSCVTMVNNCNMISIIGNDVQRNLELSKCSEIITSVGIEHLHIKHESSNKLNLSFVVDDIIATKLVRAFHREFIMKSTERVTNDSIWWRHQTQSLLNLMDKDTENRSIYAYSLQDIRDKCVNLKAKLTDVDYIYYAMKANSNPQIINEIINNGIGIECVSINELNFVLSKYPNVPILFTPNYACIKEYVEAFKYDNISVVVDSYQILESYPEVFKNKVVGIRLDLDTGDGHDKKVVTEGNNVKFGMPIEDIIEFTRLCSELNIVVNMLHTHKGSGILNNTSWGTTLTKLRNILHFFPCATALDLGGGLGVCSNGISLDLFEVNKFIKEAKENCNLKIILEPGRYFVSESGILITKVNQMRTKSSFNYLGIDAGMNAIIRPMLYNSHHPIYNMSKLSENSTKKYQVVGTICESGDIVGTDIELPESSIDDVIVIENAGAYCRTMASEYNMREYLKEVVLDI